MTTPLSEWAASGRIKIDRAYEHIRYLEGEIAAYEKRDPYPVAPHPDEYLNALTPVFPGEQARILGHLFVITEREAVNPMWSAVVADAVHNLHVALDHMWQRVTTRSGHRKNYFPAFGDPEAAKSFRTRKEKGRRHPAVEILETVNAFEIGNPFWTIREFDDTDKHDTLTLVACYPGQLSIDAKRTPGGFRDGQVLFLNRIENGAPRLPILEDGAKIYITGQIAELDIDAHLTPMVAFGERQMLQGEAVLPTLEHLATAVLSLANAYIEAGLLK